MLYRGMSRFLGKRGSSNKPEYHEFSVKPGFCILNYVQFMRALLNRAPLGDLLTY